MQGRLLFGDIIEGRDCIGILITGKDLLEIYLCALLLLGGGLYVGSPVAEARTENSLLIGGGLKIGEITLHSSGIVCPEVLFRLGEDSKDINMSGGAGQRLFGEADTCQACRSGDGYVGGGVCGDCRPHRDWDRGLLRRRLCGEPSAPLLAFHGASTCLRPLFKTGPLKLWRVCGS